MDRIKNFINKMRIKLMSQYSYQKYLKKHKGVIIGENCIIDKSVIFGTEPYLVKIGNDVRLTHNVKFITNDESIGVFKKHEFSKKC